MDSPTSDAPRQSLLAFLSRPSRPRTHAHAHAQSQAQAHPNPTEHQLPQQQQSQAASTNPPVLTPAQSQTLPPRRQNTTPGLPSPSMQTGSFGNMLRRRRSANNIERADPRRAQDVQANNNSANIANSNNTSGNAAGGGGGGGTGPTHRIRLVPHLDSVRSLNFEPISRDVRQGDLPLRIGRFTEHSSSPQLSNKLAFKSKVVSRGHAEVWFDNGSFFIKDTKSSSGTFLNHIRLSPPNAESRPFPIKDGDVLQLGVDYQGGTEEMYRCVKIRIELGREWQSGVNAFNLQALQQLKNLSNPGAAAGAGAGSGEGSSSRAAGTTSQTQGRAATPRLAGQPNNGTIKSIRPNSKTVRPKAAAAKQAIAASQSNKNNGNNTIPTSTSVSDCCICLSSVTILQALFIAPCSHAYHYKCIRPLLQMHHPGFSCPLCRTFADLEADVEGDANDIAFPVGLSSNGGYQQQDDQMVVDGDMIYGAEVFDDIVVVLEEEDEEENGGGGGSGEGGEYDAEEGTGSGSGEGVVSPSRGQRRRVGNNSASATPEADEGDAGAETDAAPESLGPAGMGGFRGLASGSGSGSGSQVRVQGFIHDPTVDVDPSAPGLRLPLREDEDPHPTSFGAAAAAANMTLSPTSYDLELETMNGGQSAASNNSSNNGISINSPPQIPPPRFVPLIIEDGVGVPGSGSGGVDIRH